MISSRNKKSFFQHVGKALIILSAIFLVSSCTYRHYLIPDDVWNESLKVTGVAAVWKRLNNSINLVRGNKTYDVTVTDMEPRKEITDTDIGRKLVTGTFPAKRKGRLLFSHSLERKLGVRAVAHKPGLL